jgi:kynurenine formamidase
VQARFVDLSHVVRDAMTTYPGLPGPVIDDHLSREASRSHYAPGTQFVISRISMVGNTGTYLDTPFHRFAEGWALDELPLDRVAGVPGLTIDAADLTIGPETLAGSDVGGKAVLFRTGWSGHWGTDRYGDVNHPHLAQTTVDALVSAGAAVVGIDSVNIDDTRTGERPAHTGLLGAGIPIVEHLTGLEALPLEGFAFYAVPVKVAGMGTFPVRAFAVLR